MLNIFSALYDLFTHFMVTELAQFSVIALCITAIVCGVFMKGR